MMYQTKRLEKPKVLPMYQSVPITTARPASLARIKCSSFFSYKGLEGLKWLTPLKKPFFLP
jgi:hypothetical protein